MKQNFSAFALLTSFMISSHALAYSDLAFPYNEVRLMPYYPQGWHENHDPLLKLIQSYQVKTVIEVGSWMGLSTIDLAKMIPDDGKVYAIDIWDYSGSYPAISPVAYAPGLPIERELFETLYNQFLSNMIHAQVANKVIPIKEESSKAAATFDKTADLIYIDSTHTYETLYADLTNWYPHLSPNGIICGDDFHWTGMSDAVYQFATEHNLNAQDNGRFWWLTKSP